MKRKTAVTILSVLLISAAIIFYSCTDDPVGPVTLKVKLGDPFTLNISQTAEFTDAKLKVTFRNIQFDSRCCDVCYCTWEGIAGVELYVQTESDRDSLFVFISGDPTAANLEMMTCEKFGFDFSLRSLWPSPYQIVDKANKPATPPLPPGAAELIVTPATMSDSISGAVNVMDIDPLAIQLGSFDLQNVTISADILAIDLNYSGGCRPHYFWAYMSPASFDEGSPREANIYLRHADFDPCRSVVSDRVYFDLSTIKEAYMTEFGRLDPIKLNVYNYFEDQPDEKVSVEYDPSQ